MKTEIIHLGRDNSIDLQLLADGAPVGLDAVTRMTLALGDSIIDSADTGQGAGQPFDWSSGGGKVTLMLGGQAILPGHYSAELVVFDHYHVNGLVWGTIRLRVV